MECRIWKLSLALLCYLVACSSPKPKDTTITKPERPTSKYQAVSDAEGQVIRLEQGWSEAIQQDFYNTPQGSEMLTYSWILSLEQKDSNELFLAPENIKSFRYLPRQKSDANPDGLPVGWTKSADSKGNEWLGLTCAACHTTQLEHTIPSTQKKLAIRIDGAPTLADFNLMNLDLVAALRATLEDPRKFHRFATAVLGEGHTPEESVALRKEMAKQTEELHHRNVINQTDIEYGFGRIDAIGFIFNQIMSTLPNMPANAKPSDAPVSYPFLWGTDQSDVVQWTGFAENDSGNGTLVRNGGEVVGVYGKVAVTSGKKYLPSRFQSSLLISNLGKMEDWVRTLQSPIWPGDIFPPIDTKKATEGATLYQQLCVSCHPVIAHKDEIETAYQAVITPLEKIDTDPTDLCNIENRTYDAGIYEGKKYVANVDGATILNPTTGLNPLIYVVTSSLSAQYATSIEAVEEEDATPTTNPTSIISGYKGRPLNGIWATAPYLHNGSVPNLYELLLPADQRSKTFVLGSRAYDPVKVGFAMDQPTTATGYTPFTLDTSIKGNWNRGHEYGTCVRVRGLKCKGEEVITVPDPGCTPLTEEQRWQLVEYMKTL